jgi:hypothetical protein
MGFSPVAWWNRDTALNTYIYAQVLISLPFSVFGTYVTYQMQIAGMMVGDDGAGGPCMTFCIVEWAGSRLDLNAVLLYMNAFGVGLGGLVTLILSAYSDYWCTFRLNLKNLLSRKLTVVFYSQKAPHGYLALHSLRNHLNPCVLATRVLWLQLPGPQWPVDRFHHHHEYPGRDSQHLCPVLYADCSNQLNKICTRRYVHEP